MGRSEVWQGSEACWEDAQRGKHAREGGRQGTIFRHGTRVTIYADCATHLPTSQALPPANANPASMSRAEHQHSPTLPLTRIAPRYTPPPSGLPAIVRSSSPPPATYHACVIRYTKMALRYITSHIHLPVCRSACLLRRERLRHSWIGHHRQRRE